MGGGAARDNQLRQGRLMGLLRRAGRWLREYVQPMVGFWDVLDRLEDLRARMDRLEANQIVLAPAVSSIGDRLHHVVTNQERLIARDGPLAAMLSREVDRLDGYLAYHAVSLQDSLAAMRDDPKLTSMLAGEVNRLDSRIA